ncbi:MAG: DUF5060 domain-containing protein [Planctomycetota bacterium]
MIALIVSILMVGLASAGGGEMRWSFEDEVGGWQARRCRAEQTNRTARLGHRSLAVECAFPTVATLERTLATDEQLDVNETPRVAYSVFTPESAGPTLKTLFFLKNKDGLWYQCVRRLPVYPGRWTEVTFDLSPTSLDVEPMGHFRRWGNETAAEIRTVGIKFFSERPLETTLYLDAIRIEKERRGPAPDLAIVNFRTSGAGVPRFARFELTFDLNRSVSNPFDEDAVAVDAEFRPPGGGEPITVPGFYYQDYVPVRRPTALYARRRGTPIKYRLLEDLVPVGGGCWKVRFAPTEVGTWGYRLRVVTDRGRESRRELVTGWREFDCTPSDRRGYVRVAKDGWNFEFTTGEPFYPIGHNMHASNDVSKRNCKLLDIEPQDDRGTAAYEETFGKMHEHGENLVEVWMASWSLGIEWTARWKHYFGPGRYNLHHAWKLDRVLELAEANDLYLHLVLENHGKLSTFVDAEWENHPYNDRNLSGFLHRCKSFFTSVRAREQYKKKLRYIIARWGWSTRILGFELWSELDLTGERWQDHADREFLEDKVRWHREMGRHIKRLDHGRHLLTTHYSGDYHRVQPEIAGLDEIDYVALDAYRQKAQGSIVRLLERTARQLGRYGKPILVTEYGGSPMGTTVDRMEAEVHAGIWSAYVMRHAGTPLLWWFMYIDRHHQYPQYKALAAFDRGEDRRNRGLEMIRPELTGSRFADCLALRNDRSAYVWVYDERSAIRAPERPHRHDGVRLTFGGFRPGAYQVEFWDTVRGRPTSRQRLRTTGSELSIELPPFDNDVALKVKPAG